MRQYQGRPLDGSKAFDSQHGRQPQYLHVIKFVTCWLTETADLKLVSCCQPLELHFNRKRFELEVIITHCHNNKPPFQHLFEPFPLPEMESCHFPSQQGSCALKSCCKKCHLLNLCLVHTRIVQDKIAKIQQCLIGQSTQMWLVLFTCLPIQDKRKHIEGRGDPACESDGPQQVDL